MPKKENRPVLTLECSVCKERNYASEKNIKETKDRLELKKFCRHCRKHTTHKETK